MTINRHRITLRRRNDRRRIVPWRVHPTCGDVGAEDFVVSKTLILRMIKALDSKRADDVVLTDTGLHSTRSAQARGAARLFPRLE